MGLVGDLADHAETRAGAVLDTADAGTLVGFSAGRERATVSITVSHSAEIVSARNSSTWGMQ